MYVKFHKSGTLIVLYVVLSVVTSLICHTSCLHVTFYQSTPIEIGILFTNHVMCQYKIEISVIVMLYVYTSMQMYLNIDSICFL